jgi:hypothetical protein
VGARCSDALERLSGSAVRGQVGEEVTLLDVDTIGRREFADELQGIFGSLRLTGIGSDSRALGQVLVDDFAVSWLRKIRESRGLRLGSAGSWAATYLEFKRESGSGVAMGWPGRHLADCFLAASC